MLHTAIALNDRIHSCTFEIGVSGESLAISKSRDVLVDNIDVRTLTICASCRIETENQVRLIHRRSGSSESRAQEGDGGGEF